VIYDILLQKFDNIKIVKLTGGYTNTTLLLEGSNPLVIAKIYSNKNIDAKTEVSCLTFLNSAGMTPRVHDCFEENELLFVIMDYVPGLNGQELLEQGDLNQRRTIFERLGTFLARDVHSLIRDNYELDLPLMNLFDPKGDEHDLIPDHLKKLVEHVLSVPGTGKSTLIHGDYGPHNVLISNDSMHIIDWEWAAWGHPLYDVAWVIWFVNLHYPHFAKELSEVFLNAYKEHSDIPITNDLIKAYSTSKVIHIINRIKYANADVKAEWLRRLAWTLQTRFV